MRDEHDERPWVYHLFRIRAADRDALAALARRGIETAIHYSPAVHPYPAGQTIG